MAKNFLENGDDLYRLHESFGKSDEGKEMKTRVRYALYKPANVSNEEWERLLGADVNNFEHLRLTYGLTRVFLLRDLENFSLDQANVLLLTAIVHDWAEAITLDITADKKTAEDEEKEALVTKELFDLFFSEAEDVVLPNEVHKVIFDKEHELFPVFNAVERIGYMRTAINAWKARNRGGENISVNLEWLIGNVLGNQIPALLNYSARFPQVLEYIDRNLNVIKEMFLKISDGQTFDLYEKEEERLLQRRKFFAAKEVFDVYC